MAFPFLTSNIAHLQSVSRAFFIWHILENIPYIAIEQFTYLAGISNGYLFYQMLPYIPLALTMGI